MNKRAIFAIVRKDLKVAVQNNGVLLPIILLPLIFFVIFPWIMTYAATATNAAGTSLNKIDQLFARMPVGLLNELSPYSHSQKVVVFMLLYMVAPMFLMVPLMVSSVIAADSFAGEKERKTLEALLYTPTTDRELFVAKLVGAWLAAMVVAFLSFLIYTIMANLAGWKAIHEIFFPNWTWISLLLWVTPAVSVLGLVVMIFVSARAQGFQDAYQIGGLVILPVVALMIGQISGVLYFNLVVVLAVGTLVWLVDMALLWVASRNFRRSELMAKF